MKILDIAQKDIVRSLRSLFLVGMMFVAPLLITGLIYLAFGGLGSDEPPTPSLRIGIVNDDRPAADQPAIGALLAQIFRDPALGDWITARTLVDETAARAALDRREIDAIVLIPANFSAQFFGGASGQNAAVRIVSDPTQLIAPAVVGNLVETFLDGLTGARVARAVVGDNERQGISLPADWQQQTLAQFQAWYSTFQQQLFQSPDAALITRAPASEIAASANPLQRLLPLILAGQMIFFAFFTAGSAMMSILRENEEGTLPRLFTTPTGRTEILSGKFVSVALLVLGQTLVMLIAGALIFRVAWGQPASAALAVIAQVVAATGLGVLLISVLKTTRQAGPALGGVLTVLGMLGGLFTVAVPAMPAAFKSLAAFTPQGWVLRAWERSLDGAAPVFVWPPAAVAFAMGVAMFVIGAILFRRRYVTSL